MYHVAIAGSSDHTRQLAQSLTAHPEFKLTWVLTPKPKPMGRKQILTINPVHQWALDQNLQVITVDKKIDATIQQQITKQTSALDFLLVVDFGYLVPTWLLELPKIAPLNVHPSALPSWRGSSPGQFVLLNGATQSSITLMVMNAGLDTGPIIAQLDFAVQENWTQTDYYQNSFKLMAQALPQLILQFANGRLVARDQPPASPTPTARQLNKNDSFVDWKIIQQAVKPINTAVKIKPTTTTPNSSSTGLLEQLVAQTSIYHLPLLLERAARAFNPWPGLWTLIATVKGQKRMKIIACHVEQTSLILDKVQVEGQQICRWKEVKNQFKEKS